MYSSSNVFVYWKEDLNITVFQNLLHIVIIYRYNTLKLSVNKVNAHACNRN